jgi:hypothetical protein
VALTQLALANAGAGITLRNASSGAVIPATVALASNVVTITPAANLPAATIVTLEVVDGALTQSVDGTGAASPNGFRTAMQGFRTNFRTA